MRGASVWVIQLLETCAFERAEHASEHGLRPSAQEQSSMVIRLRLRHESYGMFVTGRNSLQGESVLTRQAWKGGHNYRALLRLTSKLGDTPRSRAIERKLSPAARRLRTSFIFRSNAGGPQGLPVALARLIPAFTLRLMRACSCMAIAVTRPMTASAETRVCPPFAPNSSRYWHMIRQPCLRANSRSFASESKLWASALSSAWMVVSSREMGSNRRQGTDVCTETSRCLSLVSSAAASRLDGAGEVRRFDLGLVETDAHPMSPQLVFFGDSLLKGSSFSTFTLNLFVQPFDLSTKGRNVHRELYIRPEHVIQKTFSFRTNLCFHRFLRGRDCSR